MRLRLPAARSSWRRPGAERATLAELARGADALLGATFRGTIDRDFLALSPRPSDRLEVHDRRRRRGPRCGNGARRARTHCPTEANWGGVAEGTIAMMLTLLKRVRERDRLVREGGWREPPFYGTYLGRRADDAYSGITIGIVGLGRAGSRVAELLAPWRVRVLAADPYVDSSEIRAARRGTPQSRRAAARGRRRDSALQPHGRDARPHRAASARADEARRDPDQHGSRPRRGRRGPVRRARGRRARGCGARRSARGAAGPQLADF